MSQVPANRLDGRRRYTHQAYDVTLLGKSLESGPSGYGKRLSATYMASILLPPIDAGIAGAQLMGDLTEGVYVWGFMNHVPLTTGTASVILPSFNGEPDLAVTTQGIDLMVGSLILNNVNPDLYIPLPFDRPLDVVIAGGTPGEKAVISMLVTPAENGWF